MPRTRLSLRATLTIIAALAVPATATAADPGTRPFPKHFMWGVATAPFQTEMGAGHNDTHSDWWAWTHDKENQRSGAVTTDKPERGPGSYVRFRQDSKLARKLGLNTFRLGIEWSRIFPRSTASVRTPASGRVTKKQLKQLDKLAAQSAVRHYRAVLKDLRARHLTPFVTLNHFTLPSWLHDPIAVRNALKGRAADAPLPASLPKRRGWLAPGTATEFGKYASYLAWKFGDLVDVWAPINEPMVVAANGYVPGSLAGSFPPGVPSFTGAIAAVRTLEAANTDGYDAVHRWDRHAKVGLVQNMVAFTPGDPASALDRTATAHAIDLFDTLFLDAAIHGNVDANADGAIGAGERHVHGRKADFVGVNYYFRGRVKGTATPLSTAIPILDFVPTVSYRTPRAPSAPPCPTTCSDLGSEIYPAGFRAMLKLAGGYGLPVIVTENGIADAKDKLRGPYTVQHLLEVRRAMAAGEAKVTGFLEWSLMDNFEWSSGYAPKFGLATIKRKLRPSASIFRTIVKANRISPKLAAADGS